MKILGAFWVFGLIWFPLQAQKNVGTLTVNYHLVVPMGELKMFQQTNSFSGFTVDYYRGLKHHFQIGGLVGWQIFHKEYPRATYVFDNGAVTMKQWHYTHVMPFIVAVRRGFLEKECLSPFVGFGTGFFIIRQEIWAGLDEYISEGCRFGFFPEAGIRMKITDGFGLILSSKYNFIVHGQISDTENPNMHYWDFNFGAYFRLEFKDVRNEYSEYLKSFYF